MEKPTLWSFYKRLCSTVWKDARHHLLQAILTVLGVVFGVLIGQHYALSQPTDAFKNLLANGGAWASLLLFFYLIFHAARAPWKLDKQRLLQIEDLERRLHDLGVILPKSVKVNLLLGQVIEMYNELVQLSKTGGTPAYPLGYASVPFVTDKDRWNQPMVKLAVFQGRYRLLSSLVSSAALVVKDPVPPNDTRSLCGFPYEVEYEDARKHMENYLAALRAYAISLDEGTSRLATSAK